MYQGNTKFITFLNASQSLSGEENLCDHFDQYYKRTNEVKIETCHPKKKKNLKLK